MKIDLRKVPAVYMNLPQDVEKKQKMEALLTKCGFETILRVEGPYKPENPPAGCAGAHYNGLCEIDPPFVLFEDDCILLDAFNPDVKMQIKKLMIELVLATDLANHFSTIGMMKEKLQKQSFDFSVKEDKLLILKCMIKAGDVSNPTKDFM